MKLSAFLAALYISFLTFSLLALFIGETGVTSLDRLSIRNRALSSNLDDLVTKQGDLTARLDSLRSDPESIVIEARALGLYRSGDRVVEFRNIETQRTLPNAGQVLDLLPLPRTDENLFRVISLVAGIIVLLSTLVFWRVRDAAEKR